MGYSSCQETRQKTTTTRAFPKGRSTQAEPSEDPVSPVVVLTVSLGGVWCPAYSFLAPGLPSLALALSSSAVGLPRYRPSVGQGGEIWSGQLNMGDTCHTQVLCLPAPTNAQAPLSPDSCELQWAVDRSHALLQGTLPSS